MKMESSSRASDTTDNRLLILAPKDNVVVARDTIPAGENLLIGGSTIVMAASVGAGHKVARCDIPQGEKILKYGAPIGSATTDIKKGDHVHLHNIKSDYTHTHSLDAARADFERSSKGKSDEL
jgi:hypothetical protein